MGGITPNLGVWGQHIEDICVQFLADLDMICTHRHNTSWEAKKHEKPRNLVSVPYIQEAAVNSCSSGQCESPRQTLTASDQNTNTINFNHKLLEGWG
jgi:hypothetical protein